MGDHRILYRRAANRRYAVQRTLLILLMGSKCRYCSERRPWNLKFHHTKRPRLSCWTNFTSLYTPQAAFPNRNMPRSDEP